MAPLQCVTSGGTRHVQALEPEVCIKGDAVITAGTCSHLMYIFLRGEMQVHDLPCME